LVNEDVCNNGACLVVLLVAFSVVSCFLKITLFVWKHYDAMAVDLTQPFKMLAAVNTAHASVDMLCSFRFEHRMHQALALQLGG